MSLWRSVDITREYSARQDVGSLDFMRWLSDNGGVQTISTLYTLCKLAKAARELQPSIQATMQSSLACIFVLVCCGMASDTHNLQLSRDISLEEIGRYILSAKGRHRPQRAQARGACAHAQRSAPARLRVRAPGSTSGTWSKQSSRGKATTSAIWWDDESACSSPGCPKTTGPGK